MITGITITREHLEALSDYGADHNDWDLIRLCMLALEPIKHHWIPYPRDLERLEECAQRFNELRIDWYQLHRWTQSF
jgi:hypothetical protein